MPAKVAVKLSLQRQVASIREKCKTGSDWAAGVLFELLLCFATQLLPPLYGHYAMLYRLHSLILRLCFRLCTAAGGRFRGRIGRTLFQTTGLFQSVLEPDIATNKVSTMGSAWYVNTGLCS